jgi:arylformamidase
LTPFESDNYYAATQALVGRPAATPDRNDWRSHSMKIYDVSLPLSAATPTYPGDPGIEISQWLKLTDGDASNVSIIRFGAHSGTHVDAPAHFIEGGFKVEALPLRSLLGKAEVIEVPDQVRVIDENFIMSKFASGSQRVLFKTRNSSFWNDLTQGFRDDYTYIEPLAARKLVESGVKLVGIDYLSVEQFKSEKFETHHILLSNNVVILEGLDLRDVAAGSYELLCLPLKIAGGSGDGAPARAILRTLD